MANIDKTEEMVNWCSKNISEVSYYIPTNTGVYRGGIGWGMRVYGAAVRVNIHDKPMLTLFLLQFGQHNVTVDQADTPID